MFYTLMNLSLFSSTGTGSNVSFLQGICCTNIWDAWIKVALSYLLCWSTVVARKYEKIRRNDGTAQWIKIRLQELPFVNITTASIACIVN